MKNVISIAMMALFSLCCAAQNISVQSINYPTRYLRHSDSKGYLGEMLSDLDRQDASFKLVNAGIPDCPNCIRFESANYPSQYLRHSNYLIWLSALSSDLDYKDASFRLVQGLAGTGVSFESYNFPGHYLRHAYSRFRIDQNSGDDLFKNDASFNIVEALSNPQSNVVTQTNQNAQPAAIRSEPQSKPIICERVQDYYVRIKVGNKYWAGTDCTVSILVKDASGFKSQWIALDEAGDDFVVDSNYAYKVNFGTNLVSPVEMWVGLGNEFPDSMYLEGVGLDTNPDSPIIQEWPNLWLDPGTTTVSLRF